ncbi:MAG: PaaI family thioesterase, partial [Candidatus Aminicenantes bacterium]|nr:PaaI family thioesterase [Candidatus Aminicenantes bacterium]
MKIKISKKQPNSKMCFVCGLKNSFGLHSSFYELENGELMAIFSPGEEHQGYPGRLHGRIAA